MARSIAYPCLLPRGDCYSFCLAFAGPKGLTHLKQLSHTKSSRVNVNKDHQRVLPSPLIKSLASTIAASSILFTGASQATTTNWSVVPEIAKGLLVLSDLESFGDWFSSLLYTAAQGANEVVQLQLDSLSISSVAVIFGAGLVTSLSPCTLSVLPLTLGYIEITQFQKVFSMDQSNKWSLANRRRLIYSLG